MSTIYSASESSVLVDGHAVDGVQGIDYRMRRDRSNVYALGSTERVDIVSGAYELEGRLRVASASPQLDGLGGDQMFQIVAKLKHGATEATVTFDDCFLTAKEFDLSVNGHGEAIYSFSAVRVR